MLHNYKFFLLRTISNLKSILPRLSQQMNYTSLVISHKFYFISHFEKNVFFILQLISITHVEKKRP